MKIIFEGVWVVAKLIEWSILILEIGGSNSVIGNFDVLSTILKRQKQAPYTLGSYM